MIRYEPFWNTLKKQNISKYQLIYYWGISSNTLRRMGKGEAINTNTLNELCLILNCSVSDIISFEPTEEELQHQNVRKNAIASRKEENRKGKHQK